MSLQIDLKTRGLGGHEEAQGNGNEGFELHFERWYI